jgi:cellulose synthase operon protein C
VGKLILNRQNKAVSLASCVVLLLLALLASPGRSQAQAGGSDKTRQSLIANARLFETRSRPDLAIQVWQQILFSDAKNEEALAGVARDYKLMGKNTEASAALDRLRAAYPNDPNIAKIQGLQSAPAQSDQLKSAGELARSGNNEQAMRVYRQIYGDHPPDGDVALAYYQTLYGTASGKQEAVVGLRDLTKRNPGDSRYAIALGKVLTYDTKTRSEGVRLLMAHEGDPDASGALRQALIWESDNPSSAGDLRAWLRTHPNDAELAGKLKDAEARMAQMNSGIARTPEERAAFAALNAKKLSEAQQRFQAILDKDPKNPRAAAGMGFLRMQQSNFGGAISYLTQAEQNGFRDKSVENALATSRFWFTMSEASQAVADEQFDLAASKYRAALAMRPGSADALMGLAGLLTKEQQYGQAVEVYSSLLKQQPKSPDVWRGLLLSYARDGQNDKMLALAAEAPPDVRTALNSDPDYLRTLAAIYNSAGRTADAERVLAQALALPFPADGAHLKADTRMQYAGILMDSRRYSQAAEMFVQILNEDAANLSAWEGLVSAHHAMGQDEAAIGDVEKMPPAVYESALSNADFLSLLGSIYQQANRPEIAQQLIERAAKLQSLAGAQPGLQLQMQLAGIYLKAGNTDQAYGIYRQILLAHPESTDAWRGLISALQTTGHTNEAIQQIAWIPPAVLTRLEADPQFVQTEASLYAAAGDTLRATGYMNRVNAYYARIGQPLPADPAVQNAWLLYNTRNDRALYPALMRLGSRTDLTVAQREQVQTIWASWATQRSTAAFERGNDERAVEILEAASAAFPDNATVKRVLAGGYLRVGNPKAALAIYKSLPNDDASAADMQGAISAALAAGDKSLAETWLRLALARYPGDYRVLGAAAQFEQSRGDNQRAADYWKAALASLPPGSPTDKLAHELAYPDEDTKPHKAVTANDLARLLDPDDEPFPKTIKLPPLPSYGADPYLGKAPVILPNSVQSDQQAAVALQPTIPLVPTTTQIPAPPQTQTQTTEPTLTPKHHRHASANLPPPPTPSQSIPAPSLPGQSVPFTAPQSGPQTVPQPGPQSAQPIFVPAPGIPTSQPNPAQPAPNQPEPGQPTPGQSVPLYLPGQSAPPPSAQQPPRLIIPQQQVSATQSYDVQTGLKFSDASQNSTPVPQTSSIIQVEAPIRPLENAPVTLPSDAMPAHPIEQAAVASEPASLEPVQYTPSAQSAATGAYSAPQNQQQKPAATQNPAPQQPATQTPATPKKKKKHAAQPATQTVPTLVTAPAEQNQQPAAIPPPQEPQPVTPAASDQDLQQQNLPPLRGPWVRVQRTPPPIDPRTEVERQLMTLESSYSPWLGGNGIVNYRSGALGYNHLAALEAPFEVSMPWGYNARLTIVAKPVFLNSGQADGTATMSVLESTQSGNQLVAIPEPLGTDTNTGPNGTTGSTGNPPPQQNASGIGGEVQLALPHLAIAGGYTPYGLLVANWTARGRWQPGGGPFTFTFNRDAVKETQLSYGGLRDPGSASLGYPGAIWGGVIANLGEVQYAKGDALSGYYVSAGGGHLSGYNVLSNNRFDGDGGAYWRVWTLPEYGSLSIGANFFGMHYARNESLYTFGNGGYFSPQAYFLAGIPITWTGHYLTRWHYTINGGFGVQAFQQDKTPLFPLPAQKPLEVSLNNAAVPSLTQVGANYNFRAEVAHQLGQHWFVGGFLSANNSSNYNAVSGGFSVHYTFRSQPSTVTAPTGIFPSDGFRPFAVP